MYIRYKNSYCTIDDKDFPYYQSIGYEEVKENIVEDIKEEVSNVETSSISKPKTTKKRTTKTKGE